MKLFPILSLICCLTLIASCSNLNVKETKLAAPSSQKLPEGHPAINTQLADTPTKNIQRPAGGVTVEECFKNKKTLDKKRVSLRGKVIKFNSGILGKNWLHIQDGTGGTGQNDLVVTTSDG